MADNIIDNSTSSVSSSSKMPIFDQNQRNNKTKEKHSYDESNRLQDEHAFLVARPDAAQSLLPLTQHVFL